MLQVHSDFALQSSYPLPKCLCQCGSGGLIQAEHITCVFSFNSSLPRCLCQWESRIYSVKPPTTTPGLLSCWEVGVVLRLQGCAGVSVGMQASQLAAVLNRTVLMGCLSRRGVTDFPARARKGLGKSG